MGNIQAHLNRRGMIDHARCDRGVRFAPKKRIQSPASPRHQLLRMQQTMGNQTIQRLIKSGKIQTKLKIGKLNDKYEQEADRIADKVMSMPEPKASPVQRKSDCPDCPEREAVQTKPLADQITPLVQRDVDDEKEIQTKIISPLCEQVDPCKCVDRGGCRLMNGGICKPIKAGTMKGCKCVPPIRPLSSQPSSSFNTVEEEQIQSKQIDNHTSDSSNSFSSNIQNLKSGGQPLPKTTRDYFEPRFGTDFSQVRVHSGAHAAETAMSINAKAFTSGKNVVFGSGQYSPGTSEGKRLLGHELTHVVQQRMKALDKYFKDDTGIKLINNKAATFAAQKIVQPQRVSNKEKLAQVWAVGPLDARRAYYDSKIAKRHSKDTGLPGPHNGPRDAWRHCYWSCLMTNSIGESQAKEVGDIHEKYGKNPKNERVMDLWNNAAGRVCGISRSKCRICCTAKLKKGDLKVIPDWKGKAKKMPVKFKGRVKISSTGSSSGGYKSTGY